MRKVKLLALLLAALMVVTAFAGCANTKEIESDVANLDERVSALEGKIDDVKDAIEDSNADEELKAIQDALKEQQEANKALLEQIKELTDKVTKVEQDDESADDDAALQAAVKVYTAKLQELKITCELAKDDYVPADYEAVVKALSDAIVAISGAEKAEDVEKLYNDAKAVYDAKATVYTKLINYYNTVRNAITADSKDLIAEIKVFLDGDAVNNIPSAVNTVYPTIGADHKVATYKNGDKKADGTDVEVNLVTELRNAIAAYEYLTGTAFKALVADAIGKIKAINVVTIDDAGIALVSNAKTAYQSVATKINGLTDTDAKYLADSNLDLVTNYADLTAAEARLNQLTVAKAMYNTLGTVSGGQVQSVFAGYKALPNSFKANYQEKAKYDAIDNALATWVSTYALEDKNVEIIVNAAEGAGFYAQYKADRHEVALTVKAYTDFAAIANKVVALNKVTTVAASALTEYKAVTTAIEAWKVLQKEDKTVTPAIPEIVISNDNFNLILEAYGFTAKATDANMTKAKFYYGLYSFAVTAVGTFFATQYAGINDEVTAINDNIKELKANLTASTKYTDILRFVVLEGLYADPDGDGNYTKKTNVTASDEALATNGLKKKSLTIAAFTKKYEAYDLTSLLNLADFEAAKAATIERIASFKSGAANVEKLIEAINPVVVGKKNDGSETFMLAADMDKVTGYSRYCYVNLKSADKVDAANAAYQAWIESGANSDLAEWVPAVNEDGEVIADTYTLATVIDKDALADLKQMSDRIATLRDMAAKLVAHFELVAEVYEQLLPTITLDRDENTAEVEVLTLYKAIVDAGVDSNKKPVYNVVALNGTDSAISFKYQGETYDLAKKSTAVLATSDDYGSAATLKQLIDAGYKAYQAFMAMNANIIIKTSGTALNDPSKSTYAPVEAALQSIAAAELIMIKDYAMDAVKAEDELSAGQKYTFCEWLKGATAIQGETGSTIYNYAQQIYANSGLAIASKARSAKVNVVYHTVTVAEDGTVTEKDTNKGLTLDNVFAAPTYANIG